MSRIRKRSNPHNGNFNNSTVTVRRRDLLEAHENAPVDTKDIHSLACALAPLRDYFTQATIGKKRKRSYSEEEPVGTELRLLTRCPVVLSEPSLEDWPSRPKTYKEDDQQQEAERRRRAQIAAVDAKTIEKLSLVDYPQLKRSKLVEYKCVSTGSLGSLAVLQPTSRRGRDCDTSIAEARRKSVVRVFQEPSMVKPLGSGGGTHTFYFAGDSLGGRSAGYGWGYPSSFPRPQGSSGYIQDTMKRGITHSEYLRLIEMQGDPLQNSSKRRNHSKNQM